ncbi:hypothetical protein [Flavobacterium sp.]|uniref:hypothetical protein n=1 Tax=Flavobacterium sp. TaxID=239 RepID=UPI0026160247|nr:hypothetical protein [Flavobacterium sp.]
MAKLKGIVQFTGKLEGLSFYERDGEIIVRKTGGFDGAAIKTQDNYVRTRENYTEFGHCTLAGKQLRQALGSYARKAKTTHTHSHLTGLLTKIMKCDTLSERGKRTVGLGLATAEGKQLLHRFEFNPEKPHHSMIATPYEVMMNQGKVVFEHFDAEAIAFPVGATHLSLQFLLLRCDFEEGNFVLSEGVSHILNKNSSLPTLELFAVLPEGNGVLIGLVFGEFFQEVNGRKFDLRECGMSVVGVV